MADQVDKKEGQRARLFVYGTLKRGFPNNWVLMRGAQFVSVDELTGPYVMRDMGFFPGVSPVQDQRNTVHGELWELPTEVLAYTDTLEGHPTFFRRVKTKLNSGVKAWVYLIPDEYVKAERVIEDGRWTGPGTGAAA